MGWRGMITGRGSSPCRGRRWRRSDRQRVGGVVLLVSVEVCALHVVVCALHVAAGVGEVAVGMWLMWLLQAVMAAWGWVLVLGG